MANDSLAGLERSLAFGNKMLVAGLAAASGSTVAGVLYRLGSTAAIPTPTGVSAPPMLAAIILSITASAFGVVVLLAVKRATQAIIGDFVPLFGLVDPPIDMFEEPDIELISWFKKVQVALRECSSIITSPFMVRAVCAVSIFLLYATLALVFRPYIQHITANKAQMGTIPFFVFLAMFIAPSPYYFIFLKSFVIFKPSAYDTAFHTVGSVLLRRKLARELQFKAFNVLIKDLQFLRKLQRGKPGDGPD